MKLLNRNELNAVLGTVGFFATPIELIAKVEYLGGIKVFDEILQGKTLKEFGAVIHIVKRPSGIQISLASNFSSKSIGILTGEIEKVVVEHKESIIVNKEKSVIGRAILGGVLLGPVGAVVGGMSGMKSETELQVPDSVVCIEGTNELGEFRILLGCSKDNLVETARFFEKSSLPIKEGQDLKKSDLKKLDGEVDSKYANLERLGRLYKDGLLTTEEFEREKTKLLG